MNVRLWILLLVTLTAGAQAAPVADNQENATNQKDGEAVQAARFADAVKRSEAGEPKGMLDRALHHLLGLGTEIDRGRAAEWMRRAAESGCEEAYFIYGQVCQRGEIRSKDIPEALRWFRLAAAKQNSSAELSLAECYQAGQGVAVDPQEARRWLELSASHGHPIAQCMLGLELSESKEPKEAEQGNEWLRKAALQGNPSACIHLGVNHLLARGTSKNVTNGLAWILVGEMRGDEAEREAARNLTRQASKADLAKAAIAARNIGDKIVPHPIYSVSPRAREEIHAFRRQLELAQKGDPEEQFILASLYYTGSGTVADPAEAAKWCRKAAEQGHPKAILQLARSYQFGVGVPTDEKEMLLWFRKAAVLGDAEAQYCVSDYLLSRGNGKSDRTEALDWLRKSAVQGHPIAQGNLGSLLMESEDPGKRAEAVDWFKRSATQGHPASMFKYGLTLIVGYGVAKNEIEGAAWLIACDPKDDKGLRTAIKNALEKIPEASLSKAKEVAVEIRKLF